MSGNIFTGRIFAACTVAALAACTASSANAQQPMSLQAQAYAPQASQTVFDRVVRDAPYEATQQEEGTSELPANLRRQVVAYPTREAPGTIVIDTANTYLYLVMAGGQAMRYGIGVGREGFTWAGVQKVARKAEWPDWTPPSEMIERQPYLPRWMAGGPGNPLGARAMYLGNTVYRIHGTNQPSTIGHRVSSGCIRLTNEDVADLYSRIPVGTKVVVLTGANARTADARRSIAQ